MSVQKRERGGKIRWVARYRDPAGRERSRTFDTRREGAAWLDERRREMRRGEWIAPEDQAITVGELVEEWAALATKPNSVANRRALAQNLGDLEAMPIGGLRATHIEAWATQLLAGRPWARGATLAGSTVAVMVGQLRSVLERARRDGLILVVPEPEVDAETSVVVRRADLLTAADVARLVDAANTPRPRSPARPWFARMILVAAGTGLRVSELAGLRVQDVDFLGRQIHVRQQADTSGRALVPLKTRQSARTVPVPQAVVDEISAQLADVPRERHETVWARADGGLHDRSSIGGVLRRVIELHGLRRHTMHDLRHHYASALIAASVPVTGVQAALGHGSAVTTLRVYSHLWPGSEEVTRAAAAAALAAVRDQCGTGAADRVEGAAPVPSRGRSGA